MESVTSTNRYFIWGIDESAYGPVPLETLQEWTADERVQRESWVFSREDNRWCKAEDIPELKDYLTATMEGVSTSFIRKGFKPGSLRRIKILADLNEAQLAHLAEFLELKEVKQHSVLFSQGDPGDALYLVLGGELRARTLAGGRETILITVAIGDFFGEMSIFDQGPRSADVVANVDSTLLRLSATNFQRLTREAPNLATPFLQATSRTLAARIRADNKRLTRMAEQFSAGTGH